MQANRIMSVTDWVVTFVIITIHMVNIICAIYWASLNTATCAKPSRTTFSRMIILPLVISIILSFIVLNNSLK